MIGNYSERGYKDKDIKSNISSLKVSWGTRLLDTNFHPWQITPNKIFAVFGGLKIIFHPNLQLSKHCSKNIDNMPVFIKNWYTSGKMLAAKRLQVPCTLLTKFYGTTDTSLMMKIVYMTRVL